jgi:hypothetical protein
MKNFFIFSLKLVLRLSYSRKTDLSLHRVATARFRFGSIL